MLKRVADLEGAALDWAVAMAQGLIPAKRQKRQWGYETVEAPELTFSRLLTISGGGMSFYQRSFGYSTDWSQGGPIINLMFAQGLRLHTAEYVTGVHNKNLIAASLDHPNGFYYGPTPLIAAMRCYVAAKLGDETEIPDELFKG